MSKVCLVTGKKAIFNQLPDQKGDVPKTYADITKANISLISFFIDYPFMLVISWH